MKKKIIWSSVILVVIVSIYIAETYFGPADKVFLIPEGYEGCVGVIHDVKGAPELPMKKRTITYKIPDNGVLLTSSPHKIGWAYEDHSGWHEMDFYYIGDNKKKEISKDKIIGGGLASTSTKLENGGYFALGNFYRFYVGDESPGQSKCIDRIRQKAKNSPLLQK